MKAELKRVEPSRVHGYGAVEAGEYVLALTPETAEEEQVVLRLHKSVAGIKDLPLGEADAYLRVESIQRMKPELIFNVFVSIKERPHIRGK